MIDFSGIFWFAVYAGLIVSYISMRLGVPFWKMRSETIKKAKD